MKHLAIIFALLAIILSGCKEQAPPTAAEKADIQNQEAQDDVKARATQSVPVPEISNFQARKNIAEYLNRLDEPNKVWYIYERAPMSGEILGYYTSSSYPQSVCTFMTQPEEVKFHNIARISGDATWVSSTAMALDGVYYKGGNCPDFFFDYNTGAMVVLDADAVTIAVDQPLDVGAPNFSFSAEQ